MRNGKIECDTDELLCIDLSVGLYIASVLYTITRKNLTT